MSSEENILQKLPPQELEAEQMVLAACLIDPEEALSKLTLRSEDFYKSAHRDIFAAMLAMLERGEQIDLVTIAPYWKQSKFYESNGGASYPGYLVTLSTGAANIKTHQGMVIRAAQLRSIIHKCNDAVMRAYGSEDPDNVLTDCISGLNDVRRHEGSPIVTQPEFVQAGYDSLERRYSAAKEGRIVGLPTGFHDLDRVTGGLQPGYYIVAARPQMGKTALAEQIRDAVAKHFYDLWHEIPDGERPVCTAQSVGFVSIEMGKEPLALRAISRGSRIPLSRLLAGTVQGDDWDRMSDAAGALHPLPIFYEFESASEVGVSRKIDELVQKYGAGLIIIDYTQLMTCEVKHGNREQEISSISRMIKHKVSTYNIPIIALAQLNRALEARPDKRPMLADLRESGSLEQDADVIMFIYREEVYKPCPCPVDGECLCGRRGKAQILGRKGRMIGTWDVDLRWNGKITAFGDAELNNAELTSPPLLGRTGRMTG